MAGVLFDFLQMKAAIDSGKMAVSLLSSVSLQFKRRPTKRALDVGDSSPFSSIFPWTVRPGQAGFEYFLLPPVPACASTAGTRAPQVQANRIHAHPSASNANRWATLCGYRRQQHT